MLKPLEDRIVIKRVDEIAETEGGIYLPDTAQEKAMEGIVLAVGPGKYDEALGRRIPINLSPGDRVVFGKWSGDDIELDDEELLILREPNIIGILT